jgi:hypothetical protein
MVRPSLYSPYVPSWRGQVNLDRGKDYTSSNLSIIQINLSENWGFNVGISEDK